MIGKSRKLHCFKNVKSFPMLYKVNNKVCMTSFLFYKWVCNLNEKIKKTKSEHFIIYRHVPSLSDIRIEFLPPNTTLKLLPLDRGIIINNFNFLPLRNWCENFGRYE